MALTSERLTEAMESLREAMIGAGKDCANILRDEHKMLTRTIVNFTAPTPAAGAKQLGEQAVARDITKLVSEASPELVDKVGSKYGIQDVHAFVTKQDGSKLEILWQHLDPTGARLSEYHQMYRDSRGRVRNYKPAPGVWDSRVVVPKGVRDPYIKLVQQRVGRWKAKWAYAAAQLGDRYPGWITRHFPKVSGDSFYEANLEGENPSITFGGRGPNFRRNLSNIQGAVKFRAKAILRRAHLMVNGYRQDIARGMRAQANAHKHRAEQVESVD
jgi:hypothetical protein